MAKFWKIGGREIGKANELPPGVKEMKGYRLPSSGLLAADPQSGRDALDLFRTLGGQLSFSADLRSRDVQNVVFQRINQAFERQQIVAFNRAAEGGVSSGGGSGTSGRSSNPNAQYAPENTGNGDRTAEKTWVDIQLLDEDGEPVAGERYVLKLTDGSIREGALGSDGRVRVNGIDPGTCTVTFPDLHTKEWWRKS